MLSLGPNAFAVLVVLLLALRLIPHRRGPTALWEDVAWTVASALLLVGLGGVWLATFALPESVAFTTPDFSEYCRSVASAVDGQAARWSPNRSRLSGLPAILTAPGLGTQDALLVNAWVGQGLLGAGLYLWGRSLHSPVAGVAAVLAACALTPLTALGRMLTFYPMIVGTLTLSTGLVAVAWRWPGRRTALLAGVGVGLAFLVDLRGLMWGLPLLGMAGLRILALRRPKKVLPLLACLLAPVYLAWWLGPQTYPPQTTTLEVLSDLTKGWKDAVRYVQVRAPATTADGYVWSRSSVLRIPHTLIWLAEQGERVPPELRTHPDTLRALRQLFDPLHSLFLGASIVGVVGLLRRPDRILLLAGIGLPFAVALEGAVAARFAGLRFLGNGMPLLAVLGGLGFATVVMGMARTRPRDAPRLRLRAIAGMVLLVLLLVGTIDSVVSPLALWRFRGHSADAGLLTACDNPVGAPELPTWLYRLP